MKKLLLLFILTVGLNANSQVVFSENWDGVGPGIVGWTLYNVDGLTPNAAVNYVNNSWVKSAEEFDNNVALSTSWYTAAGTSNDWLVSPSIVIPAGTTNLYWDAKAYDANYPDAYKIYVSTTGNAVANFTTTLFTQGNGTTTGESSTWTRRSLDLSAYAGQTIYLGFQNFSTDMFLLGLDNISVVNNATCLAPNRIMTNTVTSTTATINWSAVAGATSYDIAIGAPGFTPVVSATSATNAHTFTGLTANTRYQYYVRNTCGSQWIGPYSIFTATTAPYAQGFETLSANGAFYADGWSTSGWSLGTTAASAHAGSQYVFRNSSTTAATNAWLFSRPLSLSAGEQVTLTFYARLGAAATAHTLKVSVAGTNNTADHTVPLSTLTISNTAYALQTINYTAPTAGTYYFGFNDATGIATTATSLRLDTMNITSVLSTNDFINNKFSVYPNPAKNVITISNNENILINEITISDLNGRIVKELKSSDITENQINVSDLQSGMYIMNIQSDLGTATKKIVKN